MYTMDTRTCLEYIVYDYVPESNAHGYTSKCICDMHVHAYVVHVGFFFYI